MDGSVIHAHGPDHGSKETYKMPEEMPLDQLGIIKTQPLSSQQSLALRSQCCTL